MPTSRSYDAIVIGAGHNGLINGAYLAKAGLRTLIVERRHLVGGAAITEELYPGFQFTTFSYALSLLRPDIIHELELTRFGFMPLLMPSGFAPGYDGDHLLMGTDRFENLHAIARRSAADADAYEQYEHDITQVAQAIKPLVDRIPPDIFSKDPDELMRMAELAGHLRSLEPRVLHNAVRLLTGSAADFLDDYFEDELLKGYLASSSIIGSKVGPRSQGSGLVLLYHKLGEHDGSFGSWAFHKGGNGGFTQVLARAAEGFGAEILLDAPVDCGHHRQRRATGVALEDGTELRGRHRGQLARPSPDLHATGRPPGAARRPGGEHPAVQVPGDLGQGQLRPRRTCPGSPACPRTVPTSAASPTSARRSTTWSAPTTRPSTGGTRRSPTSTPRSSRPSIPTWRLRASTSCRASSSTPLIT